MLKLKNDVKLGSRLPNVRISLRDEHFQNAARGPLKDVGPGPSASHFENVHFEKTINGATPPSYVYLFTWTRSTCLHKPNQLVYISRVNLFT